MNRNLPSDWSTAKLGEVVQFFDTQRKPVKESDRARMAGDYPYYGASGIIDYVSEYLFDGDYILLGEDGENILSRRSPLAIRVSGQFWVNNHAHVIKPLEGIDIDYLTHYLEGLSYERYNTGTAQPKLTKSTCEEIEVVIPPLWEQVKIADVLDACDRLVGLYRQRIELKQQCKKGVTLQLLMGQRRFSQFVHSAGTQRTPLGQIPADWNYVAIGEISRQVTERNSAGDDLPVLSCTKYDGLVDSLSYFGRQIFSEDTSTYKLVRRNQFAYATNHIEEGSIGYQDLYNEALISPMYTVFETAQSVNDRFLYALLKTETYRQIFERSTSASVDRRGSLRWNEFARIKVPLPSLLEQDAIAGVLDACDQEMALLKRKLALLKKQKQGLMQQLLKGKVRVAA